MQIMSLPGQRHELFAGTGAIARFVETPVFERKRLVRTDDNALWHQAGDRFCFFAGQQRGRLGGTADSGSSFNGTLIQIRNAHFNRNARGFQHGAAGWAAGSKHKGLIALPEGHHPSAWTRRRSASSAIMAAAVSSIDRLVTSINCQLCLAQRRRENAISSATAWRSTY